MQRFLLFIGILILSNQFCNATPFEKIYISCNQLINMPDGLYYYDQYGHQTKVKTVLGDEDGMYILVVNYECPLCGRKHSNSTPDEGYGCPIFMKEVLPKLWCR